MTELPGINRPIYNSDASFYGYLLLADDQLAPWLLANPDKALGPEPTKYYIFINGVFSHTWLEHPGYIQIRVDLYEGYTFALEYTPPTESRWVHDGVRGHTKYELHKALTQQRSISSVWEGAYDPTKPNGYFRGDEWKVERADVPAWASNTAYAINQVRKFTIEGVEKYYEAIIAHTSSASNSPHFSLGTTWRVLEMWSGHSVNLARGRTNCVLYTETKAIDPESFRWDFFFQSNNGIRHGFGFFAGSHRVPSDRGDAGIDGGLAFFLLTARTGRVEIHIKRANGTNANVLGSQPWRPFNGAVVGNADFNVLVPVDPWRLRIPSSQNGVGNSYTEHKLTLIHHHGEIALYLDDVLYGKYTYASTTYPFEHSLVSGAAQGVEVLPGDLKKHRGLFFGMVGNGQDESATPAHAVVIKSVFSQPTVQNILEL